MSACSTYRASPRWNCISFFKQVDTIWSKGVYLNTSFTSSSKGLDQCSPSYYVQFPSDHHHIVAEKIRKNKRTRKLPNTSSYMFDLIVETPLHLHSCLEHSYPVHLTPKTVSWTHFSLSDSVCRTMGGTEERIKNDFSPPLLDKWAKLLNRVTSECPAGNGFELIPWSSWFLYPAKSPLVG